MSVGAVAGLRGVYAAKGEQMLPSDVLFHRAVRGDGDPMLLSNIARQMTVFLHVIDGDGQRSVVGTGFVIAEPVPGIPATYWHYLVTARHVIEDIWQVASDGKVHIRGNSRSTSGDTWAELPIDDFRFHPADTSVERGTCWKDEPRKRAYDVAAAPCPASMLDEMGVRPWRSTLLLDDEGARREYVDSGDEVAIVGLYHRAQGGADRAITPIVRAGIVAAMPSDEPIDTRIGPMRAYLIEARSIGGLSGSPVVRISPAYPVVDSRRGDGELQAVNVSYRIIGLISGHYDVPGVRADEPINEGIAFAVPGGDILDTLRQEAFVTERDEDVRELRQSGRVGQMDSAPRSAPEGDGERVSLAGVDPEDAIRALLRTPPHAQTQDPA